MDQRNDQMLGPRKPSPIPTPNMQQAGQVPAAAPSPFPSTGFAKQGVGGVGKPALPKLMGER